MNNSVFWVGADGNIYVKGQSGVKNYGQALSTTAQGAEAKLGSIQAQRIADPNPPAPRSPGPIYPGGGGGYQTPVYAPPLDLAGISAKARTQAAGAVNPYYNQQMATYLAQVKAKQEQQQAQYQTNLTNLQDTLTNQLQGNETTRGRTKEDVATNVAQIANQADQFQTDTGQQFEDTRAQLGQQLAQSGASGGLARQQVGRTIQQAGTQEQRQTQEFQQHKDAQNLFQSRTLEDLLKSDELANTVKVKGEKQAKFDLDSYITNLNLESTQQQGQIEQQRQTALQQEESRQAKLLVNAFIQGIKNPAQQLAAAQRYGGAF